MDYSLHIDVFDGIDTDNVSSFNSFDFCHPPSAPLSNKGRSLNYAFTFQIGNWYSHPLRHQNSTELILHPVQDQSAMQLDRLRGRKVKVVVIEVIPMVYIFILLLISS